MNRLVPTPLLSTLGAAALCLGALHSSAALAESWGWYVGGGLGVVSVDFGLSDFDDGSITSGRVDGDDTGWKLFAGYRPTRHLGLEAGYVDLSNEYDGKTTFRGISEGNGAIYQSFRSAPVAVDIRATAGVYMAALGSMPLSERVAVTGKLGVFVWEAHETIIDLNPRERELDGTDAMWGLGFAYRFENNLVLRGEYEWFSDVAQQAQALIGVSVLYQF